MNIRHIKEQILEEHREEIAAIQKIPSVWRRYRAEEALRKETVARIRAIEDAEMDVLVERTLRVMESLKDDSAMVAIVRKYNGRSQHGWEVACGCDGRIKKVTRTLGWTLTSQVIWEIRRKQNIWPAR